MFNEDKSKAPVRVNTFFEYDQQTINSEDTCTVTVAGTSDFKNTIGISGFNAYGKDPSVTSRNFPLIITKVDVHRNSNNKMETTIELYNPTSRQLKVYVSIDIKYIPK